MIVSPKIRGFICTSAHPKGCEYNVKEQFNYVEHKGILKSETTLPKNVLVIGASTGYGLASRIVSLGACQANTIGIFYEKEAKGKKTASAGWYNSVAFENLAKEKGLYASSINGDAFSTDIKNQTIDRIKGDLGKVDLVIYSLASPRRTDPLTDEKYSSVLKPIGQAYTNKSIDVMEGKIEPATIEPATDEEIVHTIKVMGGEDWGLWIDALLEADVLSHGAKTIAYSYIGPEVTRAIYRDGTIGKAKEHLEQSARNISRKMETIGGGGYVVVAKALVTQASSAIPIVPLFIAALYKTMKIKGTHEGCIEQIYRLFEQYLYNKEVPVDEQGRIRIDNLEMEEDVQTEALRLFDLANTENINDIIDLEDYQKEFYKLFGFGIDSIDYTEDVIIEISMPSISL